MRMLAPVPKTLPPQELSQDRNSVYLLLRGLWKFPLLKLTWKELECLKLLSPPCFLPSLLTLPPTQTPPSSTAAHQAHRAHARVRLHHGLAERTLKSTLLSKALETLVWANTQAVSDQHPHPPLPPGAPCWASPHLPVLLPPPGMPNLLSLL